MMHSIQTSSYHDSDNKQVIWVGNKSQSLGSFKALASDLPHKITWCNDFSYSERYNPNQKIDSDHLNPFQSSLSNTPIV